jgi:hypothetical protein
MRNMVEIVSTNSLLRYPLRPNAPCEAAITS